MKLTKGKQAGYEAKNGVFANFAGTQVFIGFSSIYCLSQHGQQATWIVDTGASDHMSYDLTLFDKLVSLQKAVYVTLPDGSVKSVTLRGNVKLDNNFILQRVLYVPEFKFNLLLVTKLLADQNLCIHVYPSKCIFQDLTTNKIVTAAHEHNGLYTLESSCSKTYKGKTGSADVLQEEGAVLGCFTAVNKACTGLSLDVLHAKMKYISDCKDFALNGFFCETCILAKAHRLPFERSTISTKNPFELIHMDL